MTFLDSVKMALSSIFANKLRSFLTMLGVIIGVGSIITVVAIGKGGEASLKSKIVGSGKNTIELQFKAKDAEKSLFFGGGSDVPTFTNDSLTLIKTIPEVKYVIPRNESLEQVTVDDNKTSLSVIGVSNEYFNVNPIEANQGRVLNSNDFSQSNSVALLSSQGVKDLFKGENPVGKIIEIKGQPLQIIGTYTSKGESFGLNVPQLLTPISLWPVMYGKDDIQSLTIEAKTAGDMTVAGKKAADILNDNKPADLEGKYEVQNLEELKKGISKITNIMTAIIGGVAGISLLVGGIGVMNIMLVSVTERTREIGIRKALGATRGKILLQFLIESMMLTLIGGLIGIALGVSGAYIVSHFAKWPPLVPTEVVIGATLFSMALGVIFGLLPANKAAKLDPIEALRYE